MNNIDTFTVNVEKNLYNEDELIQTLKYDNIHACRKNDKSLFLKVSAKVLKKSDDIGGILSVSDVEKLTSIIKVRTGLELSTNVLLNLKLIRLDLKKDIHFFNEPLQYVIPSLREILSLGTKKNEIITYYNEVGYADSLLIKSICKSVKDSLCIYNKFKEMYLKRNRDNGYYYSFSEEFLESYKDVLRFERRIQWSKSLRKALHLDKNEKVTLKHVIESPYDLVGEKINNLICKIEEVV